MNRDRDNLRLDVNNVHVNSGLRGLRHCSRPPAMVFSGRPFQKSRVESNVRSSMVSALGEKRGRFIQVQMRAA